MHSPSKPSARATAMVALRVFGHVVSDETARAASLRHWHATQGARQLVEAAQRAVRVRCSEPRGAHADALEAHANAALRLRNCTMWWPHRRWSWRPTCQGLYEAGAATKLVISFFVQPLLFVYASCY